MNNLSDRPKILVVDDAPVNVKVLIEGLKRDYEIVVATDGETALKRARENAPDLVLLDIMMPGIDGFEVCRRLKAAESTRMTPVIFLTAKSEEDDETKGLKLGAADYITKPFRIPILQARVASQLKLKKAGEERARQQQLQAVLEMAGAAAHEVSQPLQVIIGEAEFLLAETDENDSNRESLTAITAAARRLGEVVSRIQNITRYETTEYARGKHIIDIRKASERL